MDQCVFHPEHQAVERCEVCDRALCGLCLWYTDDGHRLCEIHARERQAAGEPVLPPETYAEAINSSLVRNGLQGVENGPDGAPYQGNSQDLGALLAAIMAGTTLFSCVGGAYCLPVLAAALGLAAYLKADQAVDPRRTRILSGISLGVGALMLLCIVGYLVMVMGFVFFSIAVSTSGP
jgi:hypothetical protein